MIVAILFCVATVLLSWLVGESLKSVFVTNNDDRRWESYLIAGLLGFIVLSQLYCLLGLFGWLKMNIFATISILLAFPGIVRVWHQRLVGINWHALKIRNIVLPSLTLLPIILLGITVASLPPLNWDEISYGLTFPKLHIASGNLGYLTEYGIFSAFPLFGETPIGIPYLIYPDSTGVHLFVLCFLIPLLTFTYLLARRLGIQKIGAWLCTFSVAYLPLTLANLGTAKIEIYQLTYIIAAFYLFESYRQTLQEKDRILSYIFIGFAAGIKYTTIFSAPLYLCAYFSLMPLGKGVASHLKEFGKLLFCALIINLVWLVINWVNVCNPVFPNLVNLFGQCLTHPVTDDIMSMVMESTMLQKGTSWATTHSLSNFQELFVTSFGIVNTILLITALVLFMTIKSFRFLYKSKWIYVGIVLTLFIQAFMIYWEFRYTYFAFIFYIVFIVGIFNKFFQYHVTCLIIIGLFLAQGYQSFSVYLKNNPAVILFVRGEVKAEEYADKFVHLHWVATWINNNTPENALIAFNWGVQPFYYLERPFVFFHDWNPVENIQNIQTPDQFHKALKNQHASYLVWRNQDEDRFVDPSKTKAFHLRMNEALDGLQKRGSLVQIYIRDDVRIFKIHY